MPGISEFTKVCAYDRGRSGYAWSEPGPEPRTSDQIVKELHTLLGKAEIAAPYVLVGHSFGGLNLQLYASRFPEEIGGLVLIESSHLDQLGRSQDLKRMKTLGRLMRVLGPLGIPRVALPVPQGSPNSRETDTIETERALLMGTGPLRAAAAELISLETSLEQVRAERPSRPGRHESGAAES